MKFIKDNHFMLFASGGAILLFGNVIIPVAPIVSIVCGILSIILISLAIVGQDNR